MTSIKNDTYVCEAQYFADWTIEATERTGSTYVSIIYVNYSMYVRRRGGVPVGVSDFGKLLRFFGVKKKRDKHGRRVMLTLKLTPLQERLAAEKKHIEESSLKIAKRRLRRLLP